MTDTAGALLGTLESLLGPEGLCTDVERRRFYSSDLLAAGATCAAVALPADREALARAVDACTRAGYAVLPRGGGLTYVGGYTPPREKSVVFDLRRLNRILDLSPQDMTLTVEAGVTWKQIHEALAPHGLRLPFLGTFSGAGATVGGGLSNGALFFGSARYGTAAEIVLGLEVVTAEGARLYTGQAAVARSQRPFSRSFGPDLTGLFVHDSGALGIKAAATLRVMHQPQAQGYFSAGFADQSDAVAALAELARSELAEEAYVMDPNKTRDALASQGLRADLAALGQVVRQERNPLRGLVAGAAVALAGRRFARRDLHSLHVVCSGRSRAALAADQRALRRIVARHGGVRLPDTVPRGARAALFPPLEAMLGSAGERWVALNAKVAHSDAAALVAGAEAILEAAASECREQGVQVSRLLTVVGSQTFSYEPVLHWRDSWLPLHREAPQVRAGTIGEPAPSPGARALVERLRAELIALFRERGAASNQIGRSYPYLSVLRPETADLLRGLKAQLDPRGLMNPGVLELGVASEESASEQIGERDADADTV